jgi:thiol:disulfide interchange protein DsbA
MKAAFASLIFSAALLAGCGADAPAPAQAPAATPAPAPVAAPAEPAPAPATTPADAPAASETTPATPVAPAPTEAAPAPAAPVVAAPPRGPEPREGIDFFRLDPPAPFAPTPGKIEVAEVFAYTCIHCSTLQSLITPWKASLPADVEFRYVPTANGAFEPFARAFYAAEAMGVHDRTHEPMFKMIAVERRYKTGSAEELADLYAELGVDREAMLSTMRSFAINAQIARNQKAVARWAIEGTPTIIVNGRYKAVVTGDRAHDGLISTVEHLIARERAAAGTPTSP